MPFLQRFRQWCRPGLWLLWLPLSILWLEVVVRVYAFHSLLGRGLLYIPLFTFGIGLLLDFVCCMCKPRACRRLLMVSLLLCTFWFIIQTVYYNVTTTFLTLYSVGTGAGPVTQFWREILIGILQSFPVLVLEAIPFFLLVWKGRRSLPQTEPGKRLCRLLAVGAVGFYLAAVLAVDVSTGGLLSPHDLYRDAFIPELSVSNFGVLTTLRQDAQQLIFGQGKELAEELEEDLDIELDLDLALTDSGSDASPEPTYVPVTWEDNVLELDFEALAEGEEDEELRALHEYFGSREPTAKNEYTGLFEGKNLIFITAEGFSPYAVGEELTPTLYRLSTSGFVFENFYNPLWWVSTSDGEYVNCQSLIPKSGIWSMYRSSGNSLPFTLGNQLRRLGYDTYAYHNHFGDYYSRDVSHPNMGYDYKARDYGLEVSDLWPESDVELMELSVSEYLDEEPFHVYYMTMSGHLNYSFDSNAMSEKHRRAVEHLDLSQEAQAYLACNIELDQALAYLLGELERSGVLEDTVICLAPDHYPYGLDKQTIDELAGHEVEENFELYESTLILWCGDMEESITVDKPCSNLDLLPTLSNLFGLEYDSRLLMGRDILSDSEGLVVFSNHSFLTEHGRYNARTDEFIPYDDVGMPERYAQEIMGQVNDMFQYSVAVLDNNYYGVLGLFAEDTQRQS